MIELLLIRHGETAWNAEKRLQGHLDIALNENGVRQAELLAASLATEKIDAIFSSDLSRARATAAPIGASHGLSITTERDLRERCYGAFEGLRYADIGVTYPEAYAAMQARDIDYRYPSGERVAETLREFSARSVHAVTRLLKSCQGAGKIGKVAIVTHGGVLDCINRFARGNDLARPRDFDIPNTGLCRLTWDGARLAIVQWADVSHLTNDVLDEIDR